MALSTLKIKRINRLLLAWYKESARPLKIRERRDPYSVLIVEVMAQQTQISRVDQYAGRFLQRFPTLSDLAHAEVSEVLEAWRGLGYNRRALALHRAAETAHRSGGLPADHESLQRLPGIGPYTARAVATIAGGGREIPVDVNIARVVQRLVGGRRMTPKPMQAAANAFGAHLDPGEAGRWAQAAMDLAAAHCRTNIAVCHSCPLRDHCTSAGRVETTKVAKRSAAVRYASTQRWLRGRLMDELRDAGASGMRMRGARGEHSAATVTATMKRLCSEGLAQSVGVATYRLPRRR